MENRNVLNDNEIERVGGGYDGHTEAGDVDCSGLINGDGVKAAFPIYPGEPKYIKPDVKPVDPEN